jgi:hypothetical protein
VNTGTLTKTTTNSFTITVPMQQQGATVNVQAGTLTLSAGSNTHQDVSWSVASGASLVLPLGTHTFVGTHSVSHRRHAGSDGWHGAGGQCGRDLHLHGYRLSVSGWHAERGFGGLDERRLVADGRQL